ncbi:hypothetical protein D7M10_06945 [Pseudomonas fluorescens]|nr:hypothetical protein D7M10_06945 [Pseudomonas fluorescens]
MMFFQLKISGSLVGNCQLVSFQLLTPIKLLYNIKTWRQVTWLEGLNVLLFCQNRLSTAD